MTTNQIIQSLLERVTTIIEMEFERLGEYEQELAARQEPLTDEQEREVDRILSLYEELPEGEQPTYTDFCECEEHLEPTYKNMLVGMDIYQYAFHMLLIPRGRANQIRRWKAQVLRDRRLDFMSKAILEGNYEK